MRWIVLVFFTGCVARFRHQWAVQDHKMMSEQAYRRVMEG